MILIFLKNLKNQKNQPKNKKEQQLLKTQLYFLMEGTKLLMLLSVKFFQKEYKYKNLPLF